LLIGEVFVSRDKGIKRVIFSECKDFPIAQTLTHVVHIANCMTCFDERLLEFAAQKIFVKKH